MKTVSKKQILDGLQQILADGITGCEEVDVTAEKIYGYAIEPLKRAVDTQGFTEEDMRAAFCQGIYHQYPPNKGQAFDEWIKERSKQQ